MVALVGAVNHALQTEMPPEQQAAASRYLAAVPGTRVSGTFRSCSARRTI